jgi:membrane-associated phospholipid phosphatase
MVRKERGGLISNPKKIRASGIDFFRSGPYVSVMQAYYKVIVYLLVAAGFFLSIRRFLSFGSVAEYFRPDRSRILRYSAGVLMVFGLVFIDEPARQAIRSLTVLDGLFRITNEFGQGKIVFPVLALAVYLGFVFGWKRFERTAALALITSVLSGLFVQIVQTAFMRARPYLEGATPLDWFDFSRAIDAGKFFKADFRSFPSGHTATAFGVFFALAAAVRPVWLKVLLVVPAFLTAFSRVYLGKHWLSDTVASVILAAWTAAFVRHCSKETAL